MALKYPLSFFSAASVTARLQALARRALRCVNDFVAGREQQDGAQQIKEGAMRLRVSWMTPDDARAAQVGVRRNDPRLQRVVDPLADPHEEKPQEQQQGVSVLDASQLHAQRRDGACSAEPHEHLIPVLELEPGWWLVHHDLIDMEEKRS